LPTGKNTTPQREQAFQKQAQFENLHMPRIKSWYAETRRQQPMAQAEKS
jgi:hypothetical protein